MGVSQKARVSTSSYQGRFCQGDILAFQNDRQGETSSKEAHGLAKGFALALYRADSALNPGRPDSFKDAQ